MTERTGRRRRAIALVVGILLLLGLSVWALTYTPVFRARHIRVTGVDVLTAEEIRGLGGVDESTNVVHVDRDAVDVAASGTRRRDQGEMNLVRSCCVRTNGANALRSPLGEAG